MCFDHDFLVLADGKRIARVRCQIGIVHSLERKLGFVAFGRGLSVSRWAV